VSVDPATFAGPYAAAPTPSEELSWLWWQLTSDLWCALWDSQPELQPYLRHQ